MNRSIVIAVAVGALALPATVVAKPNSTDRANASKECRSERGTTDATREAFKARYGTNRNKSNAFGKCVSSNTREEHAERHGSRARASKQCRAERGTTAESRAAFKAQYGGKSNAFGKCVSQRARANKQASDQRDAEEAQARKNAAQQCDEERGETAASRAAFNAEYGRNKRDRNAFGKCVSQKAKAQNDPYAPAQP